MKLMVIIAGVIGLAVATSSAEAQTGSPVSWATQSCRDVTVTRSFSVIGFVIRLGDVTNQVYGNFTVTRTMASYTASASTTCTHARAVPGSMSKVVLSRHTYRITRTYNGGPLNRPIVTRRRYPLQSCTPTRAAGEVNNCT